jgi:ribosomal protein S18 acetylase RimI-like enzyme
MTATQSRRLRLPDVLLPWLGPEAAAIPGLRFRPFGGEPDIPAMVELYNAVNRADGNTEVWSLEEERNELRNIPHIDPGRDVILAFVDERLVATSSINYADTTDGQRLYRSRGWVHPDWRRRGIGRAMLVRNEARLRQIASGHDHTRPPRLMTWLEDGDTGGQALFTSAGYRKVRTYHHMTRPDMDDIELPPLPDDLEVRPIGQDDLPDLWDAMVEAFRDHFGGHDDTPEARRAWLEDPLMDRRLFAVAFDGDEIAGGVLGYIVAEENRTHGYARGWTDPIFTRRPWRRRGLARALLGRCLVLLRDAGMTSAQLDVDTENANAALTLYRSHRFETDRGSSEWHRPLEP